MALLKKKTEEVKKEKVELEPEYTAIVVETVMVEGDEKVKKVYLKNGKKVREEFVAL